MKTRPLGASGIEVSELCLGTMTWGTRNTSDEAHAQIARARELGITFMDTAEMYPVNPVRKETVGRTEEIIGDYFARHGGRDDWVLASKITGPGQIEPEGITPARLRAALDASLRRLRTDRVDLYQFHWPNRGSYHFRQNWTYDPTGQDRERVRDNMAAVAETMKALAQSGKVRAFGTSNETAWGMLTWSRLLAEIGGPRMAALQNEYSLLCRHYDTDLAEVAHHEGFTLLAYSPLACGMLSGKYAGGKTIPAGSRRDSNPTLGGRASETAWAASEAYVAIAGAHGLDPVTMAIAWCMARPFAPIPIIGATSVAQLDASVAGAALTLSAEVLDAIDATHRRFGMPF